MAIFHFAAQVASRSAGRSAVAMAAYRSGERLEDERTGELKYYRRGAEPQTEILAPAHSPEWVHDRNRLWNEVENAEKRKDAQLCREINIALPKEFSPELQARIVREYCQREFVDRGMIADLAIHRDDANNPHAHVMLTMREVSPDGFGKKVREWNDRELVEKWREAWAQDVNRIFEKANRPERIDHRSLEAQGINDRLATVHEGPVVREMEQRGIQTEVGQINRQVKEHNAVVFELQKYREQKAVLQEKKQLQPAERAVLRQAAAILGQPVHLESIQQKIQELQHEASRLNQSSEQLQKQLAPFEQAEIHFRNIKNWSAEFKGANTFSQAFNRESRVKQASLEKRISEARIMLEKMGFKDEGQFQDRKEKVSAYVAKELNGIKNSHAQMAADGAVLKDAEKILKQIEVRSVVEQYPEIPGIQGLYYSEAKAIQALNKALGRTVPASMIQSAYKQKESEIQGLQQKLDKIEQNEKRLQGAGQWLDKYESNQKELRKLFQPRMTKERFKSGMDNSLRMMKEFGVADRNDYNQQMAEHQKVELTKPEIQGQITKSQPGFNLLSAAFRALRDAAQRDRSEQQQKQWAKMQKRMVRSNSKDHDYER